MSTERPTNPPRSAHYALTLANCASLGCFGWAGRSARLNGAQAWLLCTGKLQLCITTNTQTYIQTYIRMCVQLHISPFRHDIYLPLICCLLFVVGFRFTFAICAHKSLRLLCCCRCCCLPRFLLSQQIR